MTELSQALALDYVCCFSLSSPFAFVHAFQNQNSLACFAPDIDDVQSTFGTNAPPVSTYFTSKASVLNTNNNN